jgi:solute carrier family 25 carnitine/acylcarnitine transporter 20/29
VYSATPDRPSPRLSIRELAFAGFFSAVPTTLVAAPAERIKVVLQVQGQGGKSQYSGPLSVISGLYKEGGIRSIFRGTGATLARDGPGSAACVFIIMSSCSHSDVPRLRYFVAYEVVKKALTPVGQDPSTLNLGAVITAGGLAGVAMWSLAIPPDVRL